MTQRNASRWQKRLSLGLGVGLGLTLAQFASVASADTAEKTSVAPAAQPTSAAKAQVAQPHSDRLVVYCTALNVICDAFTNAFNKKYGLKSTYVRNAGGATLAKMQAEAANPQGDILFGGTIDVHAQAADLGLLQGYRSPLLPEIDKRFVDPLHGQKDKRGHDQLTTAWSVGLLGYGVNLARWKKLGFKEDQLPTCWLDMLDPKFKNEIQAPDLQSSGLAYSQLTTLIALFGEEAAFSYLRLLHNNVSQYTKSGVTVEHNTARGETLMGVAFLHAHYMSRLQGAPVHIVYPCEGTSYDLQGVSILEGARHLENAKKFVDFALSAEGQELVWREAKVPQFITNVNAQQHPDVKPLDQVKLVELDHKKFGTDSERRRLIQKWLETVKTIKPTN